MAHGNHQPMADAGHEVGQAAHDFEEANKVAGVVCRQQRKRLLHVVAPHHLRG
jgi:hypothetical protein